MAKADRGPMTFMFWKVRGTSFDSNTVVSFDLVVSSCSLDVKGKGKESYVQLLYQSPSSEIHAEAVNRDGTKKTMTKFRP